MESLEEAIRRLIKENYGGVPSFARHIDEAPTSIYGALSRGMANTRTELTDKIYRALNIDWDTARLDDFRGLKLKSETRHDAWVSVPLYGSIAAGTPIEMLTVEDTFVIPRDIEARYPESFLLKVVGESMNRVIPNGSYALINPTEQTVDGKAYAVCVNGFDATIKRVRTLANGIELYPDSTDPTIKPMVFDYADPDVETVTVIGEVVWYVVPFDYEI